MEDHTLVYFWNANFTYVDQEETPRELRDTITMCVLPIEVIVGALANIWAFTVIIKRRLWLEHEGYVYLAAILITNALILILHYVSIWFGYLNSSYYIPRKAAFLCKIWNFFFNGVYCTGFLVLALLFNVCLRNRRAKKEDEAQASNYIHSRCALIVTLTLIMLTLLMNIWQLVSFDIIQYYNTITSTNEYYCVAVDDWRQQGLTWTLVAALFLYGLPIVFILPVLFALIACSGCTCTGCKYGDNSCEHFPRGTLLSIAAIIYFLQFPATAWHLIGNFLFNSYKYYMLVSIISSVKILVTGLVFTVMPILCIVTMPKLREATFKTDCCSCGQSRNHEIEAIALREIKQEK